MDLSTTIIGWVSAFIMGFITWYFTNKKTAGQKRSEEIANNKGEIESLKEAFDLQTMEYKSLLDIKDTRIDEVMTALEKLSVKIDRCETEITELKDKLDKKDIRLIGLMNCARGCTNRLENQICPVIKANSENI